MAGAREMAVLEAAMGLSGLSQKAKDKTPPKNSRVEESNRRKKQLPKRSRRTSRRAATERHKKGTYMFWQKNKKERVLCKMHQTGTTRNLPKVQLHDGTIKAIPLGKLRAEDFPVGATVQCLDTKALDPYKRKFWYDAKIIRVDKTDNGPKYVVAPVNNDKDSSVTVPVGEIRNLKWKQYEPEAVSEGPGGWTKWQKDCLQEEKKQKEREAAQKKGSETPGRDIADMIPGTPSASTPKTPSSAAPSVTPVATPQTEVQIIAEGKKNSWSSRT